MAKININASPEEIQQVVGSLAPPPALAVPPSPVPTPARAGYAAFASDPLTQQAIAKHITPPGTSILPPSPPPRQTTPPAATWTPNPNYTQPTAPSRPMASVLPPGMTPPSQMASVNPPKPQMVPANPPQAAPTSSLYSGAPVMTIDSPQSTAMLPYVSAATPPPRQWASVNSPQVASAVSPSLYKGSAPIQTISSPQSTATLPFVAGPASPTGSLYGNINGNQATSAPSGMIEKLAAANPAKPFLVLPPATPTRPSYTPAPAPPQLPKAASTNNMVPPTAASSPLMPYENQLNKDQSELQRQQTTGSGVSQIKNPWLRGLARVGDIAGSILAPGVVAAIPGTTYHHEITMAEQGQRVAGDQSALRNAEDFHNSQLQTEAAQRALNDGSLIYDKEGNPLGYHTGTGQYMGLNDPNLPQGVKDVLSGAKPKQPEYEFQQTDHGLLRIDKATGQAQAVTLNGNPIGPKVTTKTVQLQINGQPHQALVNEATGELIKDLGVSGEKPPVVNNNPGTWQPGFDKDKNPVLFNTKTGEVKPNQAGFTKETATGAKLSSDEQKRADLAKNVNENLDALDDIAARRPELFGPIAGRYTELRNTLGTNDPDITKLESLQHNLGMALQGAHSMRSAQGVEATVRSVLNGFHNSADATRASLQAARDSVRTFTDDANNPGASRGPNMASSSAPPTPASHIFSVSAWLTVNPKGNVAAATAAAKKKGYTVKP